MVRSPGLALRLAAALALAGAVSLGGWQSQDPPAPSYGYGREQDPLLLGVKQALEQAHAGAWTGVAETRTRLTPLLEELDPDGALDLEGELDAAIASRDAAALGESLARVAFQAMRLKFAENQKERLEKPVPARARLEAARSCYEEILAPAVLQADARDRTDRHPQILQDFQAMRDALGSRGLFGLGERPPDLEEFAARAQAILEAIEAVFPEFVPARPPPDPPS